MTKYARKRSWVELALELINEHLSDYDWNQLIEDTKERWEPKGYTVHADPNHDRITIVRNSE